MSERPPADVYRDLTAAGFPPQAAVVLTAIAGGESGWNPTDLGDLNLQDATWGPSYGIYQIRTVKAQTGTGSVRDIQWLAASPANQAKAAFAISQGGTDFTPWTVYTTGKWRQFLSTAQSAATGTVDAVTTDAGGPLPTVGPDWLPWNWPSNIGNAALSKVGAELGGARNIALEGAFVILGLALIGIGLAAALGPVTSPIVAGMDKARGKVLDTAAAAL